MEIISTSRTPFSDDQPRYVVQRHWREVWLLIASHTDRIGVYLTPAEACGLAQHLRDAAADIPLDLEAAP